MPDLLEPELKSGASLIIIIIIIIINTLFGRYLLRVIFRTDYCNSLLAGAPAYQIDRLQSVLNTAVRLLVGAKKHDHIKHILWNRLHWLPFPQRVQFQLCLLTFKVLRGLAPSYLADLCRPVVSVGSRQSL